MSLLDDDRSWRCLRKAHTARLRADDELIQLEKATRDLHAPDEVKRQEYLVSRLYTNFLVHASMITVCINDAWKYSLKPDDFPDWWAGIRDD
jgi:hypothetical protein